MNERIARSLSPGLASTSGRCQAPWAAGRTLAAVQPRRHAQKRSLGTAVRAAAGSTATERCARCRRSLAALPCKVVCRLAGCSKPLGVPL